MELALLCHIQDRYSTSSRYGRNGETYKVVIYQIGALLCFIIIGIDVFFVMQSLGEMSTLYPTSGAFTEMAGRFIDPAVAVALGWNYWYMVSSDCAVYVKGT